MKDAKNITGLKLAEGSDTPSRKGIYDNGFEKIDEWAGLVWDNKSLPIEDGVWDGALAGKIVTGEMTATMKNCRYYRRGNEVRIMCNIAGQLSGAQGMLVVENLPFIAKQNAPVTVGFSNIAAKTGYVQGGENFAYLHTIDSTSVDTNDLNGVDINLLLDATYEI